MVSFMGKNTYKSKKKRGVFAYLEHTINLEENSFYGLQGRYVPRLLFLLLMGIVYVGNTHHYEKTARKVSQLEREVDALRVDYTTLQADYAFDRKQSEVARRVAKKGLHETPYPPLKIKSK
jgi:hypothetical protein